MALEGQPERTIGELVNAFTRLTYKVKRKKGSPAVVVMQPKDFCRMIFGQSAPVSTLCNEQGQFVTLVRYFRLTYCTLTCPSATPA